AHRTGGVVREVPCTGDTRVRTGGLGHVLAHRRHPHPVRDGDRTQGEGREEGRRGSGRRRGGGNAGGSTHEGLSGWGRARRRAATCTRVTVLRTFSYYATSRTSSS